MQPSQQTSSPSATRAARLPLEAAQQFVRLPAVIHLTGLGRSTIYRLVAAKEFPGPVKLASRAVAWRRTDLDRWSESRPAAGQR